MHHLTDGAEPGVVQPEPGEEDLEGAELALVGVLGVEHVEPDFARGRPVPAILHEPEPRPGVDESPDEPRAGDPVDVDALPGDPGPTALPARGGGSH